MTPPSSLDPSHTPVARWEQDIGHLLRSAKRLHATLKERPDSGLLTPSQYVVLLAVSRVPGVDQRSAGDLASIDQATVSGVVRRLLARGLVTVESDLIDARRNRLFATEAALEMVRSDSAQLRRADEALLARLDETHRELLISWLSRIAYSRAVDPATRAVGEVATADVFSVTESSRAFGRLTRICNQLHAAIWREHVGTFVTPVQYTTLAAIVDDAPVNQNALTARVDLNKGTVTDLVSRLRRNGLVEVKQHHSDRRKQVISLTSNGHDVYRLTRHAERTVRALLLEPIANEQTHVLDELLLAVLNRPSEER